MLRASPRLLALVVLLPAIAALPARTARAESGIPCTGATLEPPPTSTVPANLPAFVYNLPPAFAGQIAEAKLELTDGSGDKVPFTVEGAVQRFLLKPTAPLKVGVVRLTYSGVCGNFRSDATASWAVGPEVPFPTELGKITLNAFRDFPNAGISVTVFPSEQLHPFLGTTQFTIVAWRAGMEVARANDRTASMGNDWLGSVHFPCAAAVNSGPVEIEVQARVAGASEAATLVTRSTINLTCPFANAQPDAAAPGGGGAVSPAADASADAAPATPGSSGCTIAPSGGVPFWTILLALAAVIRRARPLRRTRR
jgi:hypothetical protein